MKKDATSVWLSTSAVDGDAPEQSTSNTADGPMVPRLRLRVSKQIHSGSQASKAHTRLTQQCESLEHVQRYLEKLRKYVLESTAAYAMEDKSHTTGATTTCAHLRIGLYI